MHNVPGKYQTSYVQRLLRVIPSHFERNGLQQALMPYKQMQNGMAPTREREASLSAVVS